MLLLLVIYGEVLLLCWTRLGVALQPQDPTITGQALPGFEACMWLLLQTCSSVCELIALSYSEHPLPTWETPSAAAAPHTAPCFVDDVFAVLREGVGDSGGLTNSSLALFGTCSASDRSATLLDLAHKKKSLEVLPPAAGSGALRPKTHFSFIFFFPPSLCGLFCFLH